MSLEIYDLSHTFTQFIPEWPSSPGVNVTVKKFHAKDGVYQVEWEGIMHRCTHMDAPLHVTECTPDISDYPLWRLFGTGVAVSIPKGKWGVITAEDLENARPRIEEGDIVMINTGFHHKWGDTDEYFGYGCGIYREGAQWLVDKKVKLVGYGCQANDHPMATKLVDHGLGPDPSSPDRGVQGGDGPRPQGRLPRLGGRPQDLDGQGRHPRHREHRRRPGRGHREALHVHGASLALARRRRVHGPGAGDDRPGPDVPVRDRTLLTQDSCGTTGRERATALLLTQSQEQRDDH